MSVKLSQLKGEKIRSTIPCYFQEEFIGDIEIYNPTTEYMNYIKASISDGIISDELKLEMLSNLTNIEVDCSIDTEFIEYFNDVFVNVMIEIDSILFEISSNYALEMYSINKMSEDKKEIMEDIINKRDEIREEYKNKQTAIMTNRELEDAEAELKLAQEKLNFLRGE